MSITAIFSGIVTVASAIPQVTNLINKFYGLWIDHQVSKIDTYRINKAEKRTMLMKKISEASTNEERKVLSIILNDIV